MQFYKLNETIVPCGQEEIFSENAGKPAQFVAVVTPAEWTQKRELFNMGIELDPTDDEIISTKAEVNYDSLTGSFLIPDRAALGEKNWRFSFALDEKGVVLIDSSGKADEMVSEIARALSSGTSRRSIQQSVKPSVAASSAFAGRKSHSHELTA